MSHSIFQANEIAIVRHLHGVKLAASTETITQPSITLNELNNLPASIFFVDNDSNMCHANDNTIVLVGRQSLKDMLGKNARNFCRDDFGSLCLYNDNLAMKSRTMQISDETGYRNDNQLIQVISFKMPWYDKNKIIGALGISINTDPHNMSEFSKTLSLVVQAGLVSASVKTRQMHSASGNLSYLTEREWSILNLIARGYTAKRIGLILAISSRTVENHIARMKCKLHCYTKSDLIEFYESQG